MAEFETVTDIETRIFDDYRLAREMVQRSMVFKNGWELAQAQVLEAVEIQDAAAPEFVVATEIEDAEVAQHSLEYFKELAAQRALEEKIRLVRSELSAIIANKTVVIKPIAEDPNTIRETYYSTGLIGSHRQEFSIHRPRKANGTIWSVNPDQNLLVIKPIRGTRASGNKGFYNVTLLQQDGSPAVSIEFREPGLRDKPSKVGSAIDRAYDVVFHRSS